MPPPRMVKGADASKAREGEGRSPDLSCRAAWKVGTEEADAGPRVQPHMG